MDEFQVPRRIGIEELQPVPRVSSSLLLKIKGTRNNCTTFFSWSVTRMSLLSSGVQYLSFKPLQRLLTHGLCLRGLFAGVALPYLLVWKTLSGFSCSNIFNVWLKERLSGPRSYLPLAT